MLLRFYAFINSLRGQEPSAQPNSSGK